MTNIVARCHAKMQQSHSLPEGLSLPAKEPFWAVYLGMLLRNIQALCQRTDIRPACNEAYNYHHN